MLNQFLIVVNEWMISGSLIAAVGLAEKDLNVRAEIALHRNGLLLI